MRDAPSAMAASGLLALADQCVMCGLCLPHCPTYGLERHEAESPRGRIALARAIASGSLEASPTALVHLDHCLGCLSCQKVCPSGVRYEAILVQTRALLATRRPVRPWLLRLLADPARLTLFARLGLALRARRWLPALTDRLPAGSLLRRIAHELPARPAAVPEHAANRDRAATRGTVALFPGCVAGVLDRDTLAAARQLLERLGHAVVVPRGPVCCGALALHAGNRAGAERTAARTRAALAATGAERALVCASGCFGSLRDHALAGSPIEVEEVSTFIDRDAGSARLRFRPLPQRVALHQPCTQVNVSGGGAATSRLLARIPDLAVVPLPDQPRCCGAAGSYFLEQPEFADRLRTAKLDQVAAQGPDLLLTSNIGCRIHLDNGLRRRGVALPVLHPLTLLARQLEPEAS